MLTFKQVQSILNHLAEKLHSMDNESVREFIKTYNGYPTTFYYSATNGDGFTNLWYAYTDDQHIRLCWLTGKIFDSLPIDEFLEQLLTDAQKIVDEARGEQIKPYLARIENL